MPSDLSLQSADVPHGMHVVRVESVRYHQSQMGKGNGILVDVFHPEEGPCGWRINFTTDIRSAKYGPIKAGRLALALSGQSVDADASLGAAMYAAMCTPSNPAKGRWIQINARQGGANPKKPGEFYTEVEVVGPASAPDGASASPAPTAPSSLPVAPVAAPTGPAFPEAVQDFPAGQAGHGTHVYGASGAVYEKATGTRVQ
jgi:hypothetical protein